MRFRVVLLVQTVLVSQAGAAQHVVRIKANNAPDWGPNAKLVEELSVGDDRPDYVVRFPIRIAADDNGSFYVFDQSDTQIRRYDARGIFQRRIGRRGVNSGEYRSVSGMHVTRDGLLIVFDHASRRVTYFTSDGTVNREIGVGPNYDAGKFAVDSEGLLYLTERLPGPLEGPEARHQYVRISPAGSIVDSIAHPRDVRPLRSAFCLRTAEGRRCSFVRETLVAPWASGGMVTALSTDYSISMIGSNKTVVVERVHLGVRLTYEESAEWRILSADMEQRSVAGSRWTIPAMKPAIRDLLSDDLGRIWVDVYVAAERRLDPIAEPRSERPKLSWREQATYDVFSPDGRFLGRLQLPWNTMLLSVRGDRVFLLAKRSSAYQVIVCRIARGASSNLGDATFGGSRER